MFAGLQKVLQPAGYHIMLASRSTTLSGRKAAGDAALSCNLAAGAAQRRAFAKRPQRVDRRQHSGGGDRRRAAPIRIDKSIGIDYVAAMYPADANGDRQRLSEYRAAVRQSGTVDFPAAPAGWLKALLRNHMSPHRVINAAQPASFSTGAQQLPEFLLAWPELDALV